VHTRWDILTWGIGHRQDRTRRGPCNSWVTARSPGMSLTSHAVAVTIEIVDIRADHRDGTGVLRSVTAAA
jgi:hypothetical protein